MPFPANWLEELVVEWLELLGFTISTSVSIPARPGGKWAPDVVGARLNKEGGLLIRHCEATMWLIQGPEKVKKKFTDKFSAKVETAVRRHFTPIFGSQAAEQAKYEKWVIVCGASLHVKQALSEAAPGVNIRMFECFVAREVLGGINDWRKCRKPSSALPSDKWLLCQIDQLRHSGLIRQ